MVVQSCLVAICTNNPSQEKLRRVLESIYENKSSFRVLIVDNASTNEVTLRLLNEFKFDLIHEPELGNSHARLAALKYARENELLIFVDDDNYISSNYIQMALELTLNHPTVGVFGGMQLPGRSLIIKKRHKASLPYLGIRDLGDSHKEGPSSLDWSPLEPIGAGMCIRPEVVRIAIKNILAHLDQPNYFSLGRKGKSLLSGEDSYIARQAHHLGMNFAYFPELVLEHDIRPSRLAVLYRLRLLYGYGKTDVLLKEVLNIEKNYYFPLTFLGTIQTFIGSWLIKRNRLPFPFFHFGQYAAFRSRVRKAEE